MSSRDSSPPSIQSQITLPHLSSLQLSPLSSSSLDFDDDSRPSSHSSSSDYLIHFALRSGSNHVFHSFYLSSLRQWSVRSGFISSIVNGPYRTNSNHTYDLTEFCADSFNMVMKYVSTGNIDRLTNVMNHRELYLMSVYLGLPDEFIRYVDISVETLFFHNLKSDDLRMIEVERDLREILYANEETDFRGEDWKYTWEQVIRSKDFFNNLSSVESDLMNIYITKDLRISKGKDYNIVAPRDGDDAHIINTDEPVKIEFTYDQFHERCNTYLQGVFNDFDMTDLVIAGGIISNTVISLSQLYTLKHPNRTNDQSDIDIFITTKDPEKAKTAIRRLLTHLKSIFQNPVFVRTENAITILCKKTDTHGHMVVQVILRLYNSIVQVISGFDIDSCCAAYDGKKLYCMPRFVRSIVDGYNLVDPERQSLNYGYRLFKYLSRGFVIALPGYEHQRMLKSSINNPHATGLAKIMYQLNQRLKLRATRATLANLIHNVDPTYINDYTSYNFNSLTSMNYQIYQIAYKNLLNNDRDISSELPIEWKYPASNSDIILVNRYLIKYDMEIDMIASYSIDQIMNEPVLVDMTPEILKGVRSSVKNELIFKTRNVGTQLTNSFNPTFEDWYRDIYSVIVD
jgi:hypothetical protein